MKSGDFRALNLNPEPRVHHDYVLSYCSPASSPLNPKPCKL